MCARKQVTWVGRPLELPNVSANARTQHLYVANRPPRVEAQAIPGISEGTRQTSSSERKSLQRLGPRRTQHWFAGLLRQATDHTSGRCRREDHSDQRVHHHVWEYSTAFATHIAPAHHDHLANNSTYEAREIPSYAAPTRTRTDCTFPNGADSPALRPISRLRFFATQRERRRCVDSDHPPIRTMN